MTSTTEIAVNMLRSRAEIGLEKYGTSIDRTDLEVDAWCQHAIEEMLDGAQYLLRVKKESQAKDLRIAKLEQIIADNNYKGTY